MCPHLDSIGSAKRWRRTRWSLGLAGGSVFTVARELGDGVCSAAMAEPAHCCSYERRGRRRVNASTGRAEGRGFKLRTLFNSVRQDTAHGGHAAAGLCCRSAL